MEGWWCLHMVVNWLCACLSFSAICGGEKQEMSSNHVTMCVSRQGVKGQLLPSRRTWLAPRGTAAWPGCSRRCGCCGSGSSRLRESETQRSKVTCQLSPSIPPLPPNCTTLQRVGHGASSFGHSDFVLRGDFTGCHQLVALLDFIDGALPTIRQYGHFSCPHICH